MHAYTLSPDSLPSAAAAFGNRVRLASKYTELCTCDKHRVQVDRIDLTPRDDTSFLGRNLVASQSRSRVDLKIYVHSSTRDIYSCTQPLVVCSTKTIVCFKLDFVSESLEEKCSITNSIR